MMIGQRAERKQQNGERDQDKLELLPNSVQLVATPRPVQSVTPSPDVNTKNHDINSSSGLHHLGDARKRKLQISLAVCCVYLIGEVVGGFLSGSLALLTDAGHVTIDLVLLSLGLIAIHVSTARPASPRFTFGWRRIEVLAALISVLLIYAITGVLFYLATLRVLHTDSFRIDASLMMLTSSIAFILNLIIAFILYQPGSLPAFIACLIPDPAVHTFDRFQMKCTRFLAGHTLDEAPFSINVHVAFIHVLGDILQSMSILLASLIIYFRPSLKVADPVCTFVFGVIVIATTWQVLSNAVVILMECTPSAPPSTSNTTASNAPSHPGDLSLFDQIHATINVAIMNIFDEIRSEKADKESQNSEENKETVSEKKNRVPRALLVHNLRIWSLNPNWRICCAHVAVQLNDSRNFQENSQIRQKVLRSIRDLLHTEFQLNDVTIQVERLTPDMQHCRECQEPLI